MAQREQVQNSPSKIQGVHNFWPWLYLCICARERERARARARARERERERERERMNVFAIRFSLTQQTRLGSSTFSQLLTHTLTYTHTHTHTHSHSHSHTQHKHTPHTTHHTHTQHTHTHTHTQPASPLIIIYWLQPVPQGLTWSCYFLLSLLKMCVLSSAHTPHKKSLLKSRSNTFQNNYEMQRALAGNSWVDNLWK